MPRDGGVARAALRRAALQLFEERGYDATTTAAIANQAGLTERTFFRHFPDKREVLFDGEEELFAVMTAAIAAAPAGAAPLRVVVGAYGAAVPLFLAGRQEALRRSRIVATSPALQERSRAKAAVLAERVVGALEARGVSGATARLAAAAGAAVFERAVEAWGATPPQPLEVLIAEAAEELLALGGS